MIKKYMEPLAPYVPTVLRILVGLIFLLHGLPKWQGLDGFAGFLGSLGVPLTGLFAFLVALLETGGGLLNSTFYCWFVPLPWPCSAQGPCQWSKMF